MRLGILGAALLVVGGIAIATGVLPGSDALAVVERVAPVLGFVIAISIVAELASDAGVFRAVADRLGRWGRGRTWILWALIIVLAVLCTAFLSLDTTAVLLTPVVVELARRCRLDPLPFAMTTVWLANCASLYLPVSNLTNLLALDALGEPSPVGFLALLGPAALVATLVPVVVLVVAYRRRLTRRYEPPAPRTVDDRRLFTISAIVVALLLPLLLLPVPVWIPASIAAAVLLVVFAVLRHDRLDLRLVPAGLILFAGGLFLVVEAAHSLGLDAALTAVAGRGEDPIALLRVAASGLVGSNIANNLPAYLALEPIAEGSPARIAALLVGVDAGPLVTPWASLATLLWHARLTAAGERVGWGRVIALGAIAAPLTVAASTLVLALGVR